LGKNLLEIIDLPKPVLIWHFQNALDNKIKKESDKVELVNHVLKYFTWLIRPDVAQRQEDDETLEKQPLPPIDENLDREFEEMKRIFDKAVLNQEAPKFKNIFELERFKAFENYKNQGLRQNPFESNTVLNENTSKDLFNFEEERPIVIEDI